MKTIPMYIERLNWGNLLYFFNELDVCVHVKNGHFKLIKCSTGETTKVNLKYTRNFVACNKTGKIIFSRDAHAKIDYSKPFKYGDYSGTRADFYVCELNGTYRKTRVSYPPFLTTERMWIFPSDNENIATVITECGNVFNMDIDTLEIEEIMNLRELENDMRSPFAGMRDKFYFQKPWYNTAPNIYETVVPTKASNCTFARIDTAKRTFQYRPSRGKLYHDSTYLKEIGLWVHHRTSSTLKLPVTYSFDIRRGDEIFWRFEIECSSHADMLMYFFGRDIFSISDKEFFICFQKRIFLCNVEDLSIKFIKFNTSMADVFVDNGNRHIYPVYYGGGATLEMFTMDDFLE